MRKWHRSIKELSQHPWLLLLLAVNLVSIFGFTVFTLNPQFLVKWPWAVPIYSVSYPLFARLQIVLAFFALAWTLWRRTGFRWVSSFLWLCGLSAASELLGTTFGIPFGAYSYSDLLGPKIFGKVPYLIPLSWYFMALPSYAMAKMALPNAGKYSRWSLASLLLLSWDLTLDPAMSFLTPFWIWAETGSYYGMPLLNLLGWYVTGFVLMMALDWTRTDGWISDLPQGFLPMFYVVNLILPVGLCLAAGLYSALLVSTLVYALYFILLNRRKTSSHSIVVVEAPSSP